MDTCNAIERDRGRQYICEKPLGHPDNHRDGNHEWTQPKEIPPGATVLT